MGHCGSVLRPGWNRDVYGEYGDLPLGGGRTGSDLFPERRFEEAGRAGFGGGLDSGDDAAAACVYHLSGGVQLWTCGQPQWDSLVGGTVADRDGICVFFPAVAVWEGH